MLPTQSDWTGRGVFATRPALRETNPSNSTPPDPVRGRSEEAGEGKPTLRGRRVHYGKHSTKIGEGLATGEEKTGSCLCVAFLSFQEKATGADPILMTGGRILA